MKSGLKTTEFWGRAIASIVGLLVGSGVVQPDVGKHITDTTDTLLPIVQVVIDGIVQIIGITGALVLQYQQGKERSALKGIVARKCET
jgi:hypothetical protein